MTEKSLNDLYFSWLYHQVCDDSKPGYYKLFKCLHSIEFTYTIPMDANRAADGENLRYIFERYKLNTTYSQPIVATLLDNKPCSVLEMMVALSIRCEIDIMHDPDLGDRTGEWFWGMLDTLGISHMDDDNFNEEECWTIIDRALKREYESDGFGGFFFIPNCDKDLRDVELWYQMNWYLNRYIYESEGERL